MQKRIVILGAGESGVGAALLALSKGFEVFVSDSGAIQPQYQAILTQNHVDFEQGRHTKALILNAHEVIKSPGIPEAAPIVQTLKTAGIPVIGEVEFAARYTSARMLTITGTNGKTTTTLLLYHLLKEAGFAVGLAGNVGHSLAHQVMDDRFDIYVVELSSFQLDTLFDFKSDVAMLLNITPDHLDRYDYDFDKYVSSKFRILNNMLPEDNFIYFYDDFVIKKRLSHLLPDVSAFAVSLTEQPERGAFLADDEFVFRTGIIEDFTIKSEDVPIHGRHNHINIMVAVIAAVVAGAGIEAIKKALKTFKNASHRLEEVDNFNNIAFVNDSKATNVDAAFYALGAFNKPVVWIAGGIDKGNDYSKLKPIVRENVRAMVCLGLDNKKLIAAFKEEVKALQQSKNMDEAVKKSFELAQSGDVILLSPACASFDLFKNYEERGEQFKEAVTKLILNKREVV